MGAKHCDDYICLTVHLHILKIARPNLHQVFMHVAVAWSSSDGDTSYVIYFQFYGWHQVFTKWTLRCVTCVPKWHEHSSQILPRSQPYFAQQWRSV